MAELAMVGSEAAPRQSGALGTPASQYRESAVAPTTNFDVVAKDLVRVFKLLADETRLRILFYLMQRDELHVRALCELLGHSQPAVSHHLALLRIAGLISARREGKHNYYHVLPDRVKQLLDVLFTDVPEANRRIRFEDYVLSYAPIR
jgi:ArsR family transcriptional regulator